MSRENIRNYPAADPELRHLNRFDAERVTNSIVTHYNAEFPPPSRVLVYKQALGSTPDRFYQATIKLECDYIKSNIKSHKITIKFRLDPQSRIVQLHYV